MVKLIEIRALIETDVNSLDYSDENVNNLVVMLMNIKGVESVNFYDNVQAIVYIDVDDKTNIMEIIKQCKKSIERCIKEWKKNNV